MRDRDGFGFEGGVGVVLCMLVLVGGFAYYFYLSFSLVAERPDEARAAAERATRAYDIEVDVVKAGSRSGPSTFSVGDNDPLVTECTWRGLDGDDFSLSCGGQRLDPATLYRATR